MIFNSAPVCISAPSNFITLTLAVGKNIDGSSANNSIPLLVKCSSPSFFTKKFLALNTSKVSLFSAPIAFL